MSLDLNAIRNRAALARSIPEGPNALTRALASADDVPALLAEIERLAVYHDRYWAVEHVLNEALGPNEEDGTGEGIAADVALVVQQREEALAALAEMEQDRDRLEKQRNDALAAVEELGRNLADARLALARVAGERDDAWERKEAEIADLRTKLQQSQDRAECEVAVREQIADVFRADGEMLYTTSHAVFMVLNGISRPEVCTCTHEKLRHRDLSYGYTSRDMRTDANAGRCQDCECKRFYQDDLPPVGAAEGLSSTDTERNSVPCGCSFERWGRDSFKVSVCDEHSGEAGQ